MADLPRRIALLHRLAWACAVLVLAITTLSAFVRLAKAGVGCEPWPQCYTQRAQPLANELAPPETTAIISARIGHRIAASGALALIVAMLMIALARQPALRDPGRLVLGLLALALFLAVLGRVARDASASVVALGNLLGGMAMFGLVCRLVQTTGPRAGAALAGPARAGVLAAVALLVLQLALGGLVSAGHFAGQCGDSLTCNAHRGVALVTAIALAGVAVVARRARPGAATVLLLLVLIQGALGAVMLALALPLPLALAHNMLGVLLLAALVTLL